MEMISNPTTLRPSATKSLPTKVTAPFVQYPPQSLDLFANPTATSWQAQFSGTKMNPHQMQ